MSDSEPPSKSEYAALAGKLDLVLEQQQRESAMLSGLHTDVTSLKALRAIVSALSALLLIPLIASLAMVIKIEERVETLSQWQSDTTLVVRGIDDRIGAESSTTVRHTEQIDGVKRAHERLRHDVDALSDDVDRLGRFRRRRPR